MFACKPLTACFCSPFPFLSLLTHVRARRPSIALGFEQPSAPCTTLHKTQAYLPVVESFGFTSTLRAATGGQAFPQCVFDHWETMTQDPIGGGSNQATELVLTVRKRKVRAGLLPFRGLLFCKGAHGVCVCGLALTVGRGPVRASPREPAPVAHRVLPGRLGVPSSGSECRLVMEGPRGARAWDRGARCARLEACCSLRRSAAA